MVDDWGETEKGNVKLHGYWNISNKGLGWTQKHDLQMTELVIYAA